MTPRIAAITAALLGALPIAGCVMGGDDPPGCRTDHPEDCDDGWSCRSGVCVRPTTPLTSPEASVEAGE